MVQLVDDNAMNVKQCRVCGVPLIIGENWVNHKKDKCDYSCITCDRLRRREKSHEHGILPMYENKECALYLGCHVAENVLRNVFNNVEMMPNCNVGYDFICNKGMKIDVKSACIRNGGRHLGRWMFAIKRNKIADYFLCLAFDNRKDLNPLHMWLIDGHDINHLQAATISLSTIHKWDEYKLDINKVVECCNVQKGK